MKQIALKVSDREKIPQEIREAVKEVNLIKEGKLKAIPAKDLLRELEYKYKNQNNASLRPDSYRDFLLKNNNDKN